MDVIDRFLEQARLRPEHPAVVNGESVVTYGELERKVRAYAAAFAGFAQPRVLIALPQRADAYAAILAAGLAGGYHTPLNLASPIEKLRRICGVLQPDVIVGSPELVEALASEAPGALRLHPAGLDEAVRFSGSGVRHRLAYVMFTSGSTGMPKGVMVPRSALDHYVDWLATFGIGPSDRVSQHPNLAFDISMTDSFGALCYGATLYPLSDEGDRLMPARMIAREQITVWNSVPSVVSLMMQARQVTAKNLASVRLFNFCGEPLLREHLQAIFAVAPAVVVQNTYGPTEATIAVSCETLRATDYEAACHASVAIGDPIPGTRLELVGGASADEGEVVIFGAQLADGYWRDPDKTSLAFRDLVADGVVQRGYHTGDWAERCEGRIYFKDRIDFQVKVKGYRVELDEVAAAIRACGCPVVCVFKREDRLVAVVEQPLAAHVTEQNLREALKEKIEAHAVPELIRFTASMPRNDNDKLDRKAAAAWLDADLVRSRP